MEGQSILAGIRQFLFADLPTCVRHVLLNLASAQTMDIRSRDDPFSRLKMEDFCVLVANVRQEMEEQRQLRIEIEESIRSSKWWRNAFNAAFTVVTVGVILSSVVLAAVKVHIAVIFVTAAASVMKTVEQWISSIWEQQNDVLKEKKMAVAKKQGTLLSLYYHLEILLSRVETVQIKYSALVAAYEEYFLHQDVCNDYDKKALHRKIDELKADTDLLLETARTASQKLQKRRLN